MLTVVMFNLWNLRSLLHVRTLVTVHLSKEDMERKKNAEKLTKLVSVPNPELLGPRIWYPNYLCRYLTCPNMAIRHIRLLYKDKMPHWRHN
jgi:hypothetical protein